MSVLSVQTKCYCNGNTYSACLTIMEGSQISSSPFSIPATRTPRSRPPSGYPQARRLNLELVVIEAFASGCPSPPSSYSFLSIKSGSQISSCPLLLNDSSSAPATVPVARRGSDGNGDHAKVDVLRISFSFMVGGCCQAKSRGLLADALYTRHTCRALDARNCDSCKCGTFAQLNLLKEIIKQSMTLLIPVMKVSNASTRLSEFAAFLASFYLQLWLYLFPDKDL